MWALFLVSLAYFLQNAVVAREDRVRAAYQAGEQALAKGDLTAAKRSFREVLRMEPQDVGARVNLGVAFMRERDWARALAYLREAETLAPQITGIRLNIGLAEYRQSHWVEAVPAFASVVRDQPQSTQARRLLGLSYLFLERYGDAVSTLEPLWPSADGDLSYLYTVAVAAGNAERPDLEERALTRLLEIGKDSALVHLLVGKAYLAHEDYDRALSELQKAAQADAKLPMVHYNLGVVYRHQGEVERARTEFLQDIAIEPEVAFNYGQMGAILYELQQNGKAEAYFRDAVKRDAKLGTSWFGLAKIYKQERRYQEALTALDEAGLVDSQSASVHYLRAQILRELGRQTEARAEMAEVQRLKLATLDRLEEEVSGAKYHDPELGRGTEPQ